MSVTGGCKDILGIFCIRSFLVDLLCRNILPRAFLGGVDETRTQP